MSPFLSPLAFGSLSARKVANPIRSTKRVFHEKTDIKTPTRTSRATFAFWHLWEGYMSPFLSPLAFGALSARKATRTDPKRSKAKQTDPKRSEAKRSEATRREAKRSEAKRPAPKRSEAKRSEATRSKAKRSKAKRSEAKRTHRCASLLPPLRSID